MVSFNFFSCRRKHFQNIIWCILSHIFFICTKNTKYGTYLVLFPAFPFFNFEYILRYSHFFYFIHSKFFSLCCVSRRILNRILICEVKNRKVMETLHGVFLMAVAISTDRKISTSNKALFIYFT